MIEQIFPGEGEAPAFVELWNPSAEAQPLSEVYLSNASSYPRLVEGVGEGLGPGGFLVQLPAEVMIPAGSGLVVQLTGEVGDFEASWGVQPDVAAVGGGGVPALRVPAGGAAITSSLEGAGGLLVLFAWDGASDRVQDLDIVAWGAGGPQVDKSGLALDGPDEGEETSAYAAETPVELQSLAAAIPAGMALLRVGEEVGEVAGGNGLDGDDETSEELGASFVVEAPQPGEAPVEGVVRVSGALVPGARGPSVGGLSIRFVGAEAEFEATSDGAGLFEVELPSNATFVATVSGPLVLEAQFMLDTADADVEGLMWSVDGAWTVSGALVAGAGSPVIAGLVVSVEGTGQSQVVDGSGVFAFIFDAAGPVALVAEGPGVASARAEVVLEEESVEGLMIAVDEAWGLSGAVRDATTGEPVPGAGVALVELGRAVVADEAGSFAFEEVPPGAHTLRFEAEGYATVEQAVEVRGETTIDGALQREARYGLRVVVLTSTGDGASGAEVSLWARGGGGIIEVASADEEGVAVFPSLRSDNYVIAVVLSGFERLEVRSVPLASDATVRVMLVSSGREPSVLTEGCAQASLGGRPGGPMWAVLGALGLLVGLRGLQRARRPR